MPQLPGVLIGHTIFPTGKADFVLVFFGFSVFQFFGQRKRSLHGQRTTNNEDAVYTGDWANARSGS